MVVVLLQKVEDKIGVEKVLDHHVPRSVEFVGGLAKGNVKERSEAGVPDQKQNEDIEETFPPAVCADDDAILEAPLLLGCILTFRCPRFV